MTKSVISPSTGNLDQIGATPDIETDPLSWSKASDQTLLTGDKSGSFDLTTTGTATVGGLNPALGTGFLIHTTTTGALSIDTNTYLTSLSGAFLLDQTTPQSIINGQPIFDQGLKITAGQDIRPSADSTTAINIAQADGTDFVTFDTTNARVGIGTTSPTGKLNVLSTTEQLRLSYDVSNYMSATIGSTGSATFALTGTTPSFTLKSTADTDLVLNFFGTTNSGVLTWMENEDYFKFSDDIMFADNEAIKLGTGVDASITFDGNSLNIVANAVTSTDDLLITARYTGINQTSPTGVLHATATSLATIACIERGGLTSDAQFGSFRFLATKTTSMGNGFGPVTIFSIRDDAAVVNNIGYFGAVRSGADNTGKLVFGTYVTGGLHDRLFIESNGDFKLTADSQYFYFGAASDASITFDGNSLNIVANAVTATDTLDLTAYGVKLATPQTTTNGLTGTVVSSQPFQGTSYKKVVMYLTNFTSAGTVITFPVAFANAPFVYGDAAAIAIAVTTTTTCTLTAVGATAGNIFIEGS